MPGPRFQRQIRRPIQKEEAKVARGPLPEPAAAHPLIVDGVAAAFDEAWDLGSGVTPLQDCSSSSDVLEKELNELVN